MLLAVIAEFKMSNMRKLIESMDSITNEAKLDIHAIMVERDKAVRLLHQIVSDPDNVKTQQEVLDFIDSIAVPKKQEYNNNDSQEVRNLMSIGR